MSGFIPYNLEQIPVIGGSISTGQVAYGSSANNITGTSNFVWDAVNQRLGIGTSSPSNPLHLYHATADCNMVLQSAATNQYAGFLLQAGSQLSYIYQEAQGYAGGGNLVLLNSAAKDIVLHTNNTEKARLTSGGNLGLGAASPGTISGGGTLSDTVLHVQAGTGVPGAGASILIEGGGSGNQGAVLGFVNGNCDGTARYTRFVFNGNSLQLQNLNESTLAVNRTIIQFLTNSKTVLLGDGALLQNATDGYLYIAGNATGQPSAVPTSFTGRYPITIGGNDLYWYAGGAWRTASAGASIAGTIATNQVAFGTASNTIGGHSNFTWDGNNLLLGSSVADKGVAFYNTNYRITASDGLEHHSPDHHRFLVAGTLRGLVDANGLQAAQLRGGSGSGGNLVLTSTTNATKGKIFFGANSVFDEVNQRLGIRTTSPSYDFEISRTDGSSAIARIAAGAGAPFAQVAIASDTGVMAISHTATKAQIASTTQDLVLVTGGGAIDAVTIKQSDGKTLIPAGVFGSASSGGGLTLGSTTHATKGKIYLGSAQTSVFDEAVDSIGLGTGTPGTIVSGGTLSDRVLHVQSSTAGAGAGASILIEGGGAGSQGAVLGFVNGNTDGTARYTRFVFNGNSLTLQNLNESTLAVNRTIISFVTNSKSIILGDGALAQNATDGYFYLAGNATGAPSVAPTMAWTGRYPITIGGNDLYWYAGGAWRTAASGASIGGSIAANQVAVGSGANTIAGSSNLTYDSTNGLKVTAATANGATSLAFRGFQAGTGIGAGTHLDLGYNDADNSVARISGLYDGAGAAFAISTGTANTERLRISSGGDITAGTSSNPLSARLNLVKGSNSSGYHLLLRLAHGGSQVGDNVGMEMNPAGLSGLRIIASAPGGQACNVSFEQNDGAGSYANTMFFASSRNVLVGTSSDVTGTKMIIEQSVADGVALRLRNNTASGDTLVKTQLDMYCSTTQVAFLKAIGGATPELSINVAGANSSMSFVAGGLTMLSLNSTTQRINANYPIATAAAGAIAVSADATGGAGAYAGRVPILVAGVTKYLRYYDA